MLDRAKSDATIRYVVGLLAAGDYNALERISEGNRLSADELRQAVEDYGRTVLPSPVECEEPAAVTDAEPQSWWVDVGLHTAEEGRSDLTLSLTLIDSPEALYGVQVDDLHVL